MPDLHDPSFFSSDPTLGEGEVALVFGSKGIRIIHNDAEVRATGVFKGASVANFLMALAALEVTTDDQAFEAAMIRASKKLTQLEAPSPTATRN